MCVRVCVLYTPSIIVEVYQHLCTFPFSVFTYRISHAERQFTMSSLLQALNVDKAQVRWSDIEDAFF